VPGVEESYTTTARCSVNGHKMNPTFGNLVIDIRSGALIPVLVMLPNIVWMLLPKIDRGKQVSQFLFLRIVENIGRVAV